MRTIQLQLTGIECFIAGLEIFRKYHASDVSAEHDIVYVGTFDDVVSDEDKKTLDSLGFFWANEFDCWAYYT